MTIMSIPSIDEPYVANNLTDRTSVVPSIFHQVKLGGLAMRPSWTKAGRSCQRLHPSWTFLLWEDDDANSFVAQFYPGLYPTYRGYPLGEYTTGRDAKKGQVY
jgi:mannosyltransferase OCH1-like enzyme